MARCFDTEVALVDGSIVVDKDDIARLVGWLDFASVVIFITGLLYLRHYENIEVRDTRAAHTLLSLVATCSGSASRSIALVCVCVCVCVFVCVCVCRHYFCLRSTHS